MAMCQPLSKPTGPLRRLPLCRWVDQRRVPGHSDPGWFLVLRLRGNLCVAPGTRPEITPSQRLLWRAHLLHIYRRGAFVHPHKADGRTLPNRGHQWCSRAIPAGRDIMGCLRSHRHVQPNDLLDGPDHCGRDHLVDVRRSDRAFSLDGRSMHASR